MSISFLLRYTVIFYIGILMYKLTLSISYQKLLWFSHSVMWLFATTWNAAHHASLSFTNSRSLLRLVYESVMPSNHLALCRPLLLLPSSFPIIRVCSNELALGIMWPKYWSFNFSISPANEYSGMISFRIDWFDLPAIQGTLKNLLQHHSLKASILWLSPFFMVQLLHPCMTDKPWLWGICWQSLALACSSVSRIIASITMWPYSCVPLCVFTWSSSKGPRPLI